MESTLEGVLEIRFMNGSSMFSFTIARERGAAGRQRGGFFERRRLARVNAEFYAPGRPSTVNHSACR